MFDEITEISLLCDFYGQLLTKRQQQVLNLYHEENLSLSEIASEFSISRQGVYDTLKAGEKSLKDFENKLGLVDRFAKTIKAIDNIDKAIDNITINRKDDEQLVKELNSVKNIINSLDD